MFIKLDIPEAEKHKINLMVLKDLWRKYGHKSDRSIKSKWVKNLMHEIDPYRFYLEWDVPELSLAVLTDLKKFLNSCPNLNELAIILPNSTKFIIRKDEKVVRLYERLSEEI